MDEITLKKRKNGRDIRRNNIFYPEHFKGKRKKRKRRTRTAHYHPLTCLTWRGGSQRGTTHSRGKKAVSEGRSGRGEEGHNSPFIKQEERKRKTRRR